MRLRAIGWILVLTGTAGALFAGVAHAGPGWKPTHRVMVTGRLVDRWTVDSPGDCEPVDSGVVTVVFRMVKAKRAEVTIDPAKNAERNDTLGSWTIRAIGDAFGHIVDIPPQPAKGTITRVDDTTPRPPTNPDGEPCPPADKSDCGTKPLAHRPGVEVAGYNRKRIRGDLGADFGFGSNHAIHCGIGAVGGFSSPPSLVGGTDNGALLMKMPSRSRFRHRGAVVVKRTVHKHSSTGDPGTAQYTDDVTRSMEVRFTRIH